VPASLRSENCSPSARNAVRVPSGISVRLRRNPQEVLKTISLRAAKTKPHVHGGGPNSLQQDMSGYAEPHIRMASFPQSGVRTAQLPAFQRCFCSNPCKMHSSMDFITASTLTRSMHDTWSQAHFIALPFGQRITSPFGRMLES
jgi:hypothetical protein